MGRLDHLVEAVYERFKDRYFKNESAHASMHFVSLHIANFSRMCRNSCWPYRNKVSYRGAFEDPFRLPSINRYYARVEKVYPPKYCYDLKARDAHKDPSGSSSLSLDDEPPHVIGGDLRIPSQDAISRDDPELYYYWVHVLELEKDKSHEKGKSSAKGSEKDGKMIGSLLEVQCGMMRFVPASSWSLRNSVLSICLQSWSPFILQINSSSIHQRLRRSGSCCCFTLDS